MTREEAIGNLNMIRVAFIDTVTPEQGRLIDDTFITAREPLEQEPCPDAISRQAALDKKEKIELEDGQSFYCIDPEDVETLPSVNPQIKAGHWIAQDIHNCHTDFRCSECGYIHSFMHLYGEPTADYTYCPNCGVKMVEPQESEDLGDYPDTIHNQFDNMTGSMNL